MEYCNPSHQMSQCMPCAPRLGLNLQPKMETAGKLLSYLFSPEASNPDHPRPDKIQPGWLGPVKAWLWAGLSIVAGTVLAMLCS